MASGDPRASSGVYPGVRDCPCPFCPKKGAPRWQRWGFSRKTLLGSGEEAAICTGPSELSWALVAWLPIWNETAPLAAQPGACGESDSLRRGPLGLMFNWFPPHQGTLAPAAPSAGPAARRSPDTAHAASCLWRERPRGGGQPGWDGQGGGRWHSALVVPTKEHQAHRPLQRGSHQLLWSLCHRHPPSSPGPGPTLDSIAMWMLFASYWNISPLVGLLELPRYGRGGPCTPSLVPLESG